MACSRHFVSDKPVKLHKTIQSYWLPTLNLVIQNRVSKHLSINMERYKKITVRDKRKKLLEEMMKEVLVVVYSLLMK